MNRPASGLLAAALLLGPVASARSQAPTATPERRTLAVSVLDKEGKAVHGLTPENFRGEFRGQPVRILSASEDSSPRRLAIVVDTSASMKPNWDLAWSAAERIATALDSNHAVAFISMGENVRVHASFTADPGARRSALAQARAEVGSGKGSTGLFDGLIVSFWQFEPTRLGDSVCLISDGVDNSSIADANRVAELLARKGMRFFPILLQGSDSRRELRRAHADAKRLANASAGQLIDLRTGSDKDLSKRLALLHSSVTSAYRLEIEVPQGVDKPREWKLEVSGADGKKLKDVEVAYPRLLVPLKSK